jgi:hypothetical protein
MKTKISYSLLAAAMACGISQGAATAYTTPVGYTTTSLPASRFTLVGLTVQQPTIAAGVFTAKSGTLLTAAPFNFTTLLTAGRTYVLELPNGTIQEVTSWSGSTLTTPDNISSQITLSPDPSATTFKLRPAATISTVFGANNSVGLTPDVDGERVGTDYIQILNPAGAFLSYYYFNDGSNDPLVVGWYGVESGVREDNRAIVYADGLYVQRAAGVTKSLVVSGEVKTKPTAGVLSAGFSYLSGVAPAGLTLANSSLSSQITPDTAGELTSNDFVLIQQPSGAYFQYYYFNDGSNDPLVVGWYGVESGVREDTKPLDGGFLIFNRGGSKPYNISVPPSFSSL